MIGDQDKYSPGDFITMPQTILSDAEIKKEVLDFDADFYALTLDVAAARSAKPQGEKTKLRAMTNAMAKVNAALIELKAIAEGLE